MIQALVGTTSYIRHVFIQDTASTKGKGYAGITGGQCSLSYIRVGASAPVAVAVVDITTLGTFAGSATAAAIKAVATAGVPNPVGAYELHLPNNGLAAGAREVTFFLSDIGGSDAWAMLPIGFELVADDASTRLFDTLTTTYAVASSMGLHLRNALDSTVASRLSPSGTLATVTTVTNAISIAGDSIDSFDLTTAVYERMADTLLKRDLTVVVGEPARRSVWNALRFLLNKWSITGTTITVTREDDITAAYTAALTTDAAAVPITASDPVG